MTYKHNKAWRKRHPKKWYQGKKRYYKKSQNARNQGQIWSDDHVKQVLSHYVPDVVLAELIGRSVAAVQKARWVHKEK